MTEKRTESGIALVVTLLTLTVFSLMTLGFFFMVNGEQQTAGSEADNTIAFYGAESAVENMSYQLATLFSHTVSPTPAQISALDAQVPSSTLLPNITFPAVSTQYPNGGYYIWNPGMSGSSLTSTSETIGGTGPLAGLQGVVTPFTLTAIAQGPNNTEVKMIRQVQEVAVPIFEFGIFSNNDLSFFAGPDFSFGGRVATNGNLYLAEGSGATLTLPAKVTAFGNVIRTQLANGYSTSSAYPGTVNIVTSSPAVRSLAQNEGSLTGGPGSSANPNWNTISLTDYNGNIETAATGVKQLNMSFAIPGSGNQPINLIERAQSTDSTLLSQARLENQASVRILLSDSTSDLPDGASAVPLSGTWPSSWYPSDTCHAPLAVSPGQPGTGIPVTEQDGNFLTSQGTPLIGGYIEVDIQTAAGTWVNVTQDVLSQGITSNLPITCRNHPVVHLEELNQYSCGNPVVKDGKGNFQPCVYPSWKVDSTGVSSTNPYDYVPINMYDTREGNARDTGPSSTPANNNIYLGGVMNVVELDVGNLQWWLANDASGKLALNNAGYIVYFSDRRGNYDPAATATNGETGMYGNEDIINPSSSTGAPDSVMEAPEDVDGPNANATNWSSDPFDTYGRVPECLYNANCPTSWLTQLGLLSQTVPALPGNLTIKIVSPGQAEKNAVIFFRQELRLVNGSLGNLPPRTTANCSITQGANGSGGFTVAAENPVYILGDYNANSTGGSTFSDVPSANQCHVPAAVMGDAVTLLSDNWNDLESFNSPTNSSNRPSSVTYYRTAIMGGATIPFAQPTGYTTYQDFGTDGGVHNFLRMLEGWGTTLYYKGSIADFYYSRQATGVYKDGLANSVYTPPTRGYSFDMDFESIATLPPGTPRFTAVNALGFQQVVQAK